MANVYNVSQHTQLFTNGDSPLTLDLTSRGMYQLYFPKRYWDDYYVFKPVKILSKMLTSGRFFTCKFISTYILGCPGHKSLNANDRFLDIRFSYAPAVLSSWLPRKCQLPPAGFDCRRATADVWNGIYDVGHLQLGICDRSIIGGGEGVV